MPAAKSYGHHRRKVAARNISLFASPNKTRPRIDVLEVIDDLQSLKIDPCASSKESGNDHVICPSPTRQILGVKSGNEGIKSPARHPAGTKPTGTAKIANVERPTARVSPCVEQVAHVKSEPLSLTKSQDVYHEHVASLLKHASRDIHPFSAWSDDLSTHFAITKIAEASYGEVYRLSLRNPHPSLSHSDESVLKIIPLKAPTSKLRSLKTKAAKEAQQFMSAPENVANEVRLIQHMSCVPGFTNFRDMLILQGRPGTAFASAWTSWHESRLESGEDGSTYPDPSGRSSYSNDQLWAVIEMQDAGTDLERTTVASIFLAWDIFWSVAISVAKGEEVAEFEHRDLHLGNICISSPSTQIPHHNGINPDKKLGFTDVRTTIIDYTLSRAKINDTDSDKDKQTDSDSTPIAYLDLDQDECLFTGNGDDEYQYNIYRFMRGLMYSSNARTKISNSDPRRPVGKWKEYNPLTNLVWLHFILHELSKGIEWPGGACKKQARKGKTDRKQEREWRRARELESALLSVAGMLDPDKLGKIAVGSAGGLVEIALEKGWLDDGDIISAA